MSKLYSRQQLCDKVYSAVLNSPKPLSRLEICQAIGRKKSQHILLMIEQLHSDGWFVRTVGATNTGKERFEYAIGRATTSQEACADEHTS